MARPTAACGGAGSPVADGLEFVAPGARPVGVLPVVTCSCCGEQRREAECATLACRDDVRLCRGCIGWLAQATGKIEVTPTFPVADMDEAARFYEQAGFLVRRYDDGFAFVNDGDDSVCNLGLEAGLNRDENRSGLYVVVGDVEAWRTRFEATGAAVSSIEAMPWGMREFSVRDPSGNLLRIGRSSSA